MTRLAPFAIHRATSIEEATGLIDQHGEDAALDGIDAATTLAGHPRLPVQHPDPAAAHGAREQVQDVGVDRHGER